MPRSEFNYAQTVIGSCGHLCDGWPPVHMLGESIPWVPCDTCTAEQSPDWPAGETPGVWVRAEPPPKKRKPRKKKEPAARKAMPWEGILPT